MSDRLEDFIHRNRDAFDDKEPSDKNWKAIEQALPGAKRTTLWNSVVVWRAAAVLFMGLSVYAFIPQRVMTHKNNQTVLKEFQDVEAFYVQEISEKAHLIDQFQHSEGLNGFTHDFQQLEAMYSVLKEEMKTHPSKKVKDALVLNLLVRIDLLNQQLKKLDEKNSDESGGQGKTDEAKANA